MNSNPLSAPSPDLRIVPVEAILPHEQSDAQRSGPLMRRLDAAQRFTNPPIVADLGDGSFVLMDGSNRHLSMRLLGFAHILVQVQAYDSPFVELDTWRHVVADWTIAQLLAALDGLPGLQRRETAGDHAIAKVILRDGRAYWLHAPAADLKQRNAILRQLVDAYHRQATLYRTALSDNAQIWSLFPSGIGLVVFPDFSSDDIIAAALHGAYLPPGISRHIVQGRALNLDYPMRALREDLPLQAKNDALQAWLREQYASRGIRYYAEATFQFAE